MGVPATMEAMDLAPDTARDRTFGVNGATLRLQRAADAFDPVAWRAPAYPRTARAPANDAVAAAPAPVPRWMVVSGGGVAAALLGALLGSALSL
jgi:hypothetical protein